MAQTGISAAIAPASTITLTTDQLEDIITQALIWTGNVSSSSALSVLPGKFSSWLLDSACCNHMTPVSLKVSIIINWLINPRTFM